MTEEEETPVLTNHAAADRLRELLRQLTTEEPPLSTRLIKRLSPTTEERWRQTLPTPDDADHPNDPPGAAA